MPTFPATNQRHCQSAVDANSRSRLGSILAALREVRKLHAIAFCAIAMIYISGCGRRAPVPIRVTKKPTVVSTVPAATDLIIGMGCADHLVGICTFDPSRPQTADLPKVGDYLTVDWEAIGFLHPGILVTGLSDGRRPAGFEDRAARAGCRPIFLEVKRLDDIDPAILMLGEKINEPAKAAAAVKELDARLATLTNRSAGRPPVPTLLVIDADPGRVAGPGSYLDDMLVKAGGVNVVTRRETGYPTLDREELQKLRPRVIIQLLTDPSPAEAAKARDAWKTLPGITAPVEVIADPYAQNPGWHVADIAEKIAEAIAGR